MSTSPGYATFSLIDKQSAIANFGWVWKECTFPNGEVILKFKRTKEFNPYYSTYECDFLYSFDGWEIGWGRYQRHYAWSQAYDAIVLGHRQSEPFWELNKNRDTSKPIDPTTNPLWVKVVPVTTPETTPVTG